MPVLPRRALPGLAGLAGLALATASCDPFDASSPVPGPSKDELLVEQVVADVRRLRDQAATEARDALVAMHDAHLAALGAPATPASPSPLPVSTTAPEPDGSSAYSSRPTLTFDPADIGAGETALKTALATGAAEAESGSLARLLASMAAAVSQQLVALR